MLGIFSWLLACQCIYNIHRKLFQILDIDLNVVYEYLSCITWENLSNKDVWPLNIWMENIIKLIGQNVFLFRTSVLLVMNKASANLQVFLVWFLLIKRNLMLDDFFSEENWICFQLEEFPEHLFRFWLTFIENPKSWQPVTCWFDNGFTVSKSITIFWLCQVLPEVKNLCGHS